MKCLYAPLLVDNRIYEAASYGVMFDINRFKTLAYASVTLFIYSSLANYNVDNEDTIK